MNTLAVITVHNPSENLIRAAEELISACISQIIIVDNGSGSAGRDVLGTISSYPGCTVLSLARSLPGNEALAEAFACYDRMLCGEKPADRLYIANADDERSLEYMLERVAGDEPAITSLTKPAGVRSRAAAEGLRRRITETMTDAAGAVRRLCVPSWGALRAGRAD